MTKRMDRKEVLHNAFHEVQTEILHYYNLTPEERQAIADAAVEVNDWEGQPPALPVATWVAVGHRHSWIALELLGRNRAPIEALGRWAAHECLKHIKSFRDQE